MAAGKGYDNASAGLAYPKGGQSEMNRNQEGQSSGYYMTSLLIVPCHIVGMLALSFWKRKLFRQSDKFAGHVGEGLHLHSIGM